MERRALDTTWDWRENPESSETRRGRLDGNGGGDQMRGEEGGAARLVRSAADRFTVGCRDARRDMHAMDCHQQIRARSACTDIGGAVK